MDNNGKANSLSWAFFVGCMFIGIALGMIYGNVGAGTLIGMGIGLIGKFFISRKS